MERITYGNSRVKKRARVVKQTNEVVVSNKIPGRMVEVGQYREDLGLWPDCCGPHFWSGGVNISVSNDLI